MGHKNSTPKMKSAKENNSSSRGNSAKVVPVTSAAAPSANTTKKQEQQHPPDPTSSSPLPDTVPLSLLKTLPPLSGTSPIHSQIWRFDKTTVLKRCGPSKTAEATAMQLVSSHTSIPVPKVLKILPEEGYLFMEYIPNGAALDTVWDDLSPDNKRAIIGQLKGYMRELIDIQGEWIGSVDKSQCNEQILSSGKYGPFDDENGFREGIASSLKSYIETEEQDPTWVGQVIEFVQAIPGGRPVVMTHGDFVPRNVLVRKKQTGDGQRDGDEWEVAAIVDWEMAGFYPSYWEYVKAHLFADYQHGWMVERVVDEVLPYRNPLELAVLVHAKRIVLPY